MKSKSQRLIVVAATAVMLLIGVSVHAQPYTPPSGPILIRPFGDSITYGFGFADGTYCPTYMNGQAWCGVPWAVGGGYRGWMTAIVLYGLETNPPSAPFIFMTEGHQSGGSSVQQWQTATQIHDGYPGFRTDQLIPTSSLPSFADITLVHAGTNDILQGIDIGQAATNLSTILKNLLDKNSGKYVFVAKIIPFAKPASSCIINGTPCTDYSTRNQLVTNYNKLIDQRLSTLSAAQQERITVVDMSSLLNGQSGITPDDDYFLDGVHPNFMGYMKIACTWIRAIQGVTPVPAPAANRCPGLGPPAPPMPTQEQIEQMMQDLPRMD